MDYSHRDRRAHRTVARAFAVLFAFVVALTIVALLVPGTVPGLASFASLVLAGFGAVLWGDRVAAEYGEDLRTVGNGTAVDRFVRLEVASRVGLERVIGRPSERSPHSRRRPGSPGSGGGAALDSRP
jgi:hypothetical protein